MMLWNVYSISECARQSHSMVPVGIKISSRLCGKTPSCRHFIAPFDWWIPYYTPGKRPLCTQDCTIVTASNWWPQNPFDRQLDFSSTVKGGLPFRPEVWILAESQDSRNTRKILQSRLLAEQDSNLSRWHAFANIGTPWIPFNRTIVDSWCEQHLPIELFKKLSPTHYSQESRICHTSQNWQDTQESATCTTPCEGTFIGRLWRPTRTRQKRSFSTVCLQPNKANLHAIPKSALCKWLTPDRHQGCFQAVSKDLKPQLVHICLYGLLIDSNSSRMPH